MRRETVATANGRAPDHTGVDAAIDARGLVKRYGDKVALAGVDITVRRGTVTAVLGPNGAGKTTAIRAITGALAPHEGTVRTFGCDPSEEGDLVRPHCGVVSAKPALYDRLSGYDNLLYSAQLYDVPKARIPERIDAVATRFGIGAALSAQVGGFSTGMKTRLALARSVLHEPTCCSSTSRRRDSTLSHRWPCWTSSGR